MTRRNDPAAVLGDLCLVDSWHKHLGLIGGSASSLSACEKARVEIWIAPVHSLVRPCLWDAVLSPAEVDALRQVRSPSARDSLIAGRSLLRLALSHAVNGCVAPRDWDLRILPSGKLEISEGFPQLYFSISHTERIAVVAISEKLRVGIDAESIEQSVERAVASHFCGADEQALLSTLPVRHSMREMIRLWTLKEAYAKLIGFGAAIDFSSLEFSLDSFRLAQGSEWDESQAHFETMFVSSGNGLSHVSLALGLPPDAALDVNIQVMTLGSKTSAGSRHVPCISIPVAAPHAERVPS